MASLLRFKATAVVPRVCVIAAAAVNSKNSLGLASDAYITSGNDSKHAKGSKHYSGDALDLRTRDMSPVDVQRWATSIRGRLGRDYDVVIESDHLHVEHDPK